MTLAERITKEVFDLGSEPGSPCTRIEFKALTGDADRHEVDQGGMCEDAFFRFMQDIIAEHKED